MWWVITNVVTVSFCVGVMIQILMGAYKWGGIRRRNTLLQRVVSAWQQHDIGVVSATESILVTTWLDRIESRRRGVTTWRGQGKGILGTIVHVVIAVIVFITTVTISIVIATKNGIINCSDIKRRRIFATTTFAMEMWTRCMGFSGSWKYQTPPWSHTRESVKLYNWHHSCRQPGTSSSDHTNSSLIPNLTSSVDPADPPSLDYHYNLLPMHSITLAVSFPTMTWSASAQTCSSTL